MVQLGYAMSYDGAKPVRRSESFKLKKSSHQIQPLCLSSRVFLVSVKKKEGNLHIFLQKHAAIVIIHLIVKQSLEIEGTRRQHHASPPAETGAQIQNTTSRSRADKPSCTRAAVMYAFCQVNYFDVIAITQSIQKTFHKRHYWTCL